jgi:S-adenosylmethionine:tRNA ribosyltransferase-isomerase
LTRGEEFAAAYDYELPPELIAQHPVAQRDQSRLLVVGREAFQHRSFADVPDILQPGDVLVLNDTRVIAARLRGTRDPSGGAVELLLLHPAGGARYDERAASWIALARPARRLRAGEAMRFGEFGRAHVTRELDEGMREVVFETAMPFAQFLAAAGRLPLPPYVHADDDELQSRYQTVFARTLGSVAAPTASLHFTEDMLERVRTRGVEIAYVTLDVGLGTFRPMKTERIDAHVMHAERYEIPIRTVEALTSARRDGRRIVAAGTTVVRTLEGCVHDRGSLQAGEGSTSLFIKPGFRFALVDAMITNFHLPQSTLLVLVSAFAGRERILEAYQIAVEERYRFFSFGDAMFLER